MHLSLIPCLPLSVLPSRPSTDEHRERLSRPRTVRRGRRPAPSPHSQLATSRPLLRHCPPTPVSMKQPHPAQRLERDHVSCEPPAPPFPRRPPDLLPDPVSPSPSSPPAPQRGIRGLRSLLLLRPDPSVSLPAAFQAWLSAFWRRSLCVPKGPRDLCSQARLTVGQAFPALFPSPTAPSSPPASAPPCCLCPDGGSGSWGRGRGREHPMSGAGW